MRAPTPMNMKGMLPITCTSMAPRTKISTMHMIMPIRTKISTMHMIMPIRTVITTIFTRILPGMKNTFTTTAIPMPPWRSWRASFTASTFPPG